MLGMDRDQGRLRMDNLGMATRTGERMETVNMGWLGYCSLPIVSSAQMAS